jgi:hypothetical protein
VLHPRKAGLQSEVLFWTSFDPLLETRLTAWFFFLYYSCWIIPAFLVIFEMALLLPWLVLLLAIPCLHPIMVAEQARGTFWILCRRKIIFAVDGVVKTVPLSDVRACKVNSIFISVLRFTTEGDNNQGIVHSAAGMKQHKWFAQAVLNQISIYIASQSGSDQAQHFHSIHPESAGNGLT